MLVPGLDVVIERGDVVGFLGDRAADQVPPVRADAFCEPKPVQSPRPPFVIGGRGEKRLLRSTAMWADHYNYPRDDVDDFRYRLEVLHRWCDEVGRDPSEIETSLQIRVHEVGEAVGHAATAGEAGADHVIFYFPPPPTLGLLEQLAEASEPLIG